MLNGGAAEAFQGLRKLLSLSGNGAMCEPPPTQFCSLLTANVCTAVQFIPVLIPIFAGLEFLILPVLPPFLNC